MKSSELQALLKTLHHQLNILQEREAKFGGNAPLDLLNQINDHRQAIVLVEAAMQGDVSNQELEAQLAPLNLGLDRGATDIMAGKNIVKIGNVTVPALPLVLAVLVVLGLLAVAVWYFLVPSQMPLNTFNVAVADFGQVDAQGRVSVSKDGQNLSAWMFDEMQAEYKNWPGNLPVVWHDSMNFWQKRSRIGLVSGHTPAARQQAAQVIAKRLGAHMVIYGNIAAAENPPRFTPEFYITDLKNEADEIVGVHQLGSPIEVRLPLDLRDQRAGNFFQQNLGVRADALVWFTRGLALDLSGRHKDALAVFNEAASSPQLQSWNEAQGRRILDYFIGREALFLTRSTGTALDETKAAYLESAETAFKKALGNGEGYPRAHIGLGGVYFQRAQSFPPPERLENNYVDLALDEYSQAIAAESGTGSQLEIKGLLGLGKTYRLLGEAHLFAENYDQALPAYEQAVASLEKGIDLLEPNQHRDLAETYHALGTAYHGWGHIQLVNKNKAASQALFEKAFIAYKNCIDEAGAEFYDTTLQALKNNFCEPKRENVLNVLSTEF